jgi:hypothetical protein
MLSSTSAISIFRRELTLGMLLRGLLGCLALNLWPSGKSIDGSLLLVGLGMLWMVLSYRSVKGQRLAAESPSLIAAGHFDEAEQQIEEALRSFSLFGGVKMLSLHHLALLRHAQKHWQDSADLCRTLLKQKFGAIQGIARPSRLLLADALLELGDVRGAYAALAALYQERLSLGEAMNLLLIQLDYESRLGAWEAMLPRGMAYKRVQLAELMPAASSARAQAFMALAAHKTGRPEWAAWLRARAELLADSTEISKERPVLAELWNVQKDGAAAAAHD